MNDYSLVAIGRIDLLKKIVVFLALSFVLSGCSAVRPAKNGSVYQAKYIEIVVNGVFQSDKLVLLPVWEQSTAGLELYEIRAKAVKQPDFSLDVSVWHHAVKKLLVAHGQKKVESQSLFSGRGGNDRIKTTFEGYLVSPAKTLKFSFDPFNYEAHGTYEVLFSREKPHKSLLQRLIPEGS